MVLKCCFFNSSEVGDQYGDTRSEAYQAQTKKQQPSQSHCHTGLREAHTPLSEAQTPLSCMMGRRI